MIISNCNCGKNIDCGCTLSFSDYVVSPVSKLDVGTLLGGSCAFDEYVIDWYRDGEFYMTSGVGTDPDITAYHPFNGTSAIPVIGGVYVPVVRYVVITGQGTRLSRIKKKCQDWCEFAGTLPTITVSSLNCTSYNYNSSWQYRILYQTSQDYSLATRSFRWDLDVDTRYISFWFTASLVADKIEVFLNDSTTPVHAWIVGTNNNTAQDSVLPYNYYGYSIKFVFDNIDFVAGDYLIVQITPSVLETNINTQWDLMMQCLDDTMDFEAECAILSNFDRTLDISNPQMVWNATSCYYEIWISFLTPPTYPSANFEMYSGYGTGAWYNYFWDKINNKIGLRLSKSTAINPVYFPSSTSAPCAAAHGTNNYSISGMTITFTFDNDTDYNAFKDRYDSINAGDWRNTWVDDDPLDINYYRVYQIYWLKAPIQCGDTQTLTIIYFHIDSTVTFTPDGGGGGTMEVTKRSVTNEFEAPATCYSRANFDQTISLASAAPTTAGTGDTVVIPSVTGHGLGFSPYATNQWNVSGGMAMATWTKKAVPCIPDYSCDYSTIGKVFFYFFMWLQVTAPQDENGDFTIPPEDNFKLFNALNFETGCIINQVLIYEIQYGIQIFPIP